MDELGPVSPRTYPPAPGWSPDGHSIKAPLEYSRGPEKVWLYGALRVRDGKALTLTAPSRNTKGYLRLLEAVAQANPTGELHLVTDNLSSHKSSPIREWLENHPRVKQVFIPVGACWLNLQEAWWRLFRREALAGQRASPTPQRSNWLRGSPQNSSTSGRSDGCGDVYRSHADIGGALLFTAFEERSTTGSLLLVGIEVETLSTEQPLKQLP